MPILVFHARMLPCRWLGRAIVDLHECFTRAITAAGRDLSTEATSAASRRWRKPREHPLPTQHSVISARVCFAAGELDEVTARASAR